MPCPGLLHGTPGAVGAAPASCPTQHAAAQELRASMREQSRKGKAVSAHTPFRFTLLCHVSWNAQTQRERMLTEEHSRHSSGWIHSKRVQRWAMLWDGSCVRALPPSGLSLPCDTTGSRERAMWEQGLARGSWLQNEWEKSNSAHRGSGASLLSPLGGFCLTGFRCLYHQLKPITLGSSLQWKGIENF